mgnify:CR=1 FL=1
MERTSKETQCIYQPLQIRKPALLPISFQGSAADGELDKQGRTLIPSVLRTYAKLDKEVVFVGMGKRARYGTRQMDEKNAEVELNIEEIASDMEASGFSI